MQIELKPNKSKLIIVELISFLFVLSILLGLFFGTYKANNFVINKFQESENINQSDLNLKNYLENNKKLEDF